MKTTSDDKNVSDCLESKKNRLFRFLRLEPGSRGATMVEAAIALPIFVFFLLALIDFARVLTVTGILNTGASKAASLASVINDLENTDTVIRDANIDAIRARARELPLNTLLADEFTSHVQQLINADEVTALPVANPVVVNIPNDFRANPIEVEIYAQVDTYLPLLGPINVVGRSLTYREPRDNSSLPVALDCEGNPLADEVDPVCPCLSSSDPLATEVNPEDPNDCFCDDELVFDFGYNTDSGKFECECIDENFDRVGNECKCTLTCDPNEIPENDCSGCVGCPGFCIANAEADDCVRPEPIELSPPCDFEGGDFLDECSCEACPGNKKATAADPEVCVCPIEEVKLACYDADSEFREPFCDCLGCVGEEIFNDATKLCECPEEVKQTCNDAELRFKAGACECGDPCPEDYNLSNDGTTCVCDEVVVRDRCITNEEEFSLALCDCIGCKDEEFYNTELDICECPAQVKINCNDDDERFDREACDCAGECPNNLILDSTGTGCECPESDVEASCRTDQIFSSGLCDCICPSGFDEVDGVCIALPPPTEEPTIEPPTIPPTVPPGPVEE